MVNKNTAILIENAADGFYITIGGTKTFWCNQEDSAADLLAKVFKFLGFKNVDTGEAY